MAVDRSWPVEHKPVGGKQVGAGCKGRGDNHAVRGVGVSGLKLGRRYSHQSVDWERVGEKASTIVDSRNAMASVEGVTASVYKI